MTSPRMPYTRSPLDRAAHLRGDPAWIADRLASRESLFLAVWNDRSHVTDIDSPQALLLSRAHADTALQWADAVVFLGLMDTRAIFALDLSPLGEHELPGAVGRLGRFEDLRLVGPAMPQEEGALLAYARGITHWHRRHRFCPRCGSPTAARDGGFARVCAGPACGATQFPRTDPAVIMLVHDGGERCVLGTHPRMPAGMFSTLAGFVEPGESLEEAVAREVAEEVGLDLDTREVRYFASQPWPFPASLMLGFHARADYAALRVDEEELSAARWYHRDELLKSPEDKSFRLPRRDSIAHKLIQSWLDEQR